MILNKLDPIKFFSAEYAVGISLVYIIWLEMSSQVPKNPLRKGIKILHI